MEEITIKTATINLDQLLKWADLVASGGEAKNIIQAGKIRVNQEVETRRSKTIKVGDIVSYNGNKYRVVSS